MYYPSSKPRYSPIAPIGVLEQLYDKGLLGNYLLLLAPEVLEEPQRYIDLIDHIRSDEREDGGTEAFIIMDNGLIENGRPLEAHRVIEAATYVEADCIQIPDVLGERMMTQKKVMGQKQELLDSGYPLMKIPQGADSAEQVKCTEWLRDSLVPGAGAPDYWGIPRWITNTVGSRIPLIQYINASTENPQIHLLGMSHMIDDDLRCCGLPGVIGIDSANPLVLGWKNRSLSSLPRSYIHASRGEYMQKAVLNSVMADNVEYMHELVSGFPSQTS